MWALMPRSDVTCGFFRIQMLLALGLSVLSGLTIGQYAVALPEGTPLLSVTTQQIVCGVMAFLAYVGSVLWTIDKRGPGTVVIFSIFGLASLLLVSTVATTSMLTTTAGWMTIASEISSALILGGAMTGMLLGHWYLTAPTMSIKPLSTLTLLFGGAVLIRLVLSSVAIWMHWGEVTGSTQMTWLTLRWIAGVAGPVAVFIMTWRILKYRNTQSATGVLFVGVILTFLGELSALLLYRALHVPL